MSFATMNIMELIRSDSNLNALTGIPKIKYLDQITKISKLVLNTLQYNIHCKLGLRERITTYDFHEAKIRLNICEFGSVFWYI